MFDYFLLSEDKAVKSDSHPYIPNSLSEIKRRMMHEIGVASIEELYSDVPKKYRVDKLQGLPKALSEFGVKKHVENLLSKNKTYKKMPMFLGGGCWPHYVPAVVKDIVQRSELFTSYTPYQPEISQGMLQALFEYQSLICELTDMEVANSSMYDWGSALGEAARMAMRLTGRREIVIPHFIHPERLATLQVYAESAGIRVSQLSQDMATGQTSLDDLRKKVSNQTAAVYVENPSYLGFIEASIEELSQETHSEGAIFIVGVDPTSLGVLKPPGAYGADIVIGEAQPLGNHMNFGGPLLGVFACRDDLQLIRQMPGRIIGMTTTKEGNRQGFCMVLQTREQHIRREKATSNICSNQAMCAVASAVYMALLGPEGLRRLGETIIQKANYTINLLSNINGVKAPIFEASHFKEFTVNFNKSGLSVKRINESLLNYGIHGGIDVSHNFPELGNTALYCVTEIHSKYDIEQMVSSLTKVLIDKG
ncbi:MAG: aminomethyl-transferring glycine dehydrogenase subunit GcvPA [Candidatus Bathyarchaeota archaeon]